MNEPPDESAAGGAALFDEKSFYLEEFYGKSLLFALIPPGGERVGELNSLVRTLRVLRRNQARCIVIVPAAALARIIRRLGRLAPAAEPPVFNPGAGLRSRPYPPDSAVAQIWRALSAGSVVVAAADTDKPADFTVFAQELASRLRVFKLILLDRQGGLTGNGGERMSFVELSRIGRAVRKERGARRRAELRAVARALRDGVGSVNLVAPREVYDELFSFVGTGTLFTERQYGFVRPISIDDFEEVEALILRGQREGYLLARSREEIAQLLPSCFGYRVGDEHLAGVCSLLTERYHRERAGEITALYTLTRFAGEGVAVELVKQILHEARERPLRYVFACAAKERAAKFFVRLGFRRVGPRDIPSAKWRGYDPARMSRLEIFRYDLD
ncbi:MAG TPA: GNAT family N-acetyltransferase [Candidatus Binataceae bacterium]|nr:GNAT family N-acetyltransferase [Candidatus Binataceae bacterium]